MSDAVMQLPEGNRQGPNCGVTALAVVAGVPFATVWADIKRHRKRRGAWRGRMFMREYPGALRRLGVKHKDMVQYVGRRVQLRTWATLNARPGVRYMVRTGGHMQVVKDGYVIDQGGCKPIREFWGRRKLVTHVIEIVD